MKDLYFIVLLLCCCQFWLALVLIRFSLNPICFAYAGLEKSLFSTSYPIWQVIVQRKINDCIVHLHVHPKIGCFG